MNVMSYNLRFNQAIGDLEILVKSHLPDILCLQECDDKTLPAKILSLSLVQSTNNSNGEGMAIYANLNLLKVTDTSTHTFPKSLMILLSPYRERLIVSKFKIKASGKNLVLANLHATHPVVTNSRRRREIKHSIEHARAFAVDQPFVLIGDFNYPFFNKALAKWANKHGVEMHESDTTTFRNRYMTGYFDKAMSYKLHNPQVITLPFMSSDHAAIHLSFET